MRRLALSLVVCASLAACTAKPPPAIPPPVHMPDWTPNILRQHSPDDEESEELDEPGAERTEIKRAIYDAPRAKANCALPAVNERSRSAKQRYLDKVASCLDKIWARELREVDLPFTPPRRRYVQKRVKHPVCGLMPVKGADGTYCDATETYFIVDDPSHPRRPWKAWATHVAAHEYGHHVQYLTRILHRHGEMWEAATAKKARNLLSRRLELQAECFSGVALRAMRDELPPWDEFRYLYSGTLAKRWTRTHGRVETQYRWMRRGFQSGKPGSCDTWSPRAGKVT